ncbi:hypothetical protein [Rippkaea orientalis]|nr:hypothetical protein [Rippkaea orientalis]
MTTNIIQTISTEVKLKSKLDKIRRKAIATLEQALDDHWFPQQD